MAASYYDQHLRNPRSKKFYNSSAWKRCRKNKLAETPWCEYDGDGQACGAPALHVHHVKPIVTPDGWEHRLSPAWLKSVCIPCHNRIEAEANIAQVPSIAGIYQPVEDDRFYYDPEAAELPIRFIEKFCRHYEGRWAGQLMKLLDWQKQITRTLYGWKRRDNSQRRFTELFLLTAKGSGKTPWMSAIGCFEIFAGGEPAAHVVSMATDYKQACLTQDWGKKSILQDAQLSKRCRILQFEIQVPRTNAKWDTLSGTFSGRAGFRPSAILADEAWEWPNSKLYDSVSANLFKRSQPLLLVSTNAGETRNCFAWTLYERAKAVLSGKSERTDLLPVIFEAPVEMDWQCEEAARLACPSIPEIITFEDIKPKIVAAQGDAEAESKYRRLHLSQWVSTGINKWLNIATWDAVTVEKPIAGRSEATVLSEFPAGTTIEIPKSAALYVGLDLSEGDDLCSAALVYCTPDKLFVRWRHWLPKSTAEKYQDRGFPEAERRGFIRLLDDLTIGPKVRREIAGELLDIHRETPVQMVCFDAYRADECVAMLESAGVKCSPIRQGYGVSSGCAELERRLKEKSIAIEENSVSRAAAEVVEVKSDPRGNFWPVKPGAKGRYAGTRSIKIDPIAALVTALVEARKHEWPAHQRQWTGRVVSI